jgi:hypothetical protein
MNYREWGAQTALSNLGLKIAAFNTPAIRPLKSLLPGVQEAETALSGLKAPAKLPFKAETVTTHPSNMYREIMGPAQYKWPSSSKELNYRLFQQAPAELRAPINYAT